MPKVLIIGRFHDDGMRLFQARPDVLTEIVDGADEAELTEKIRDADGVTIRTSLLPGHVLDRAERLKVVFELFFVRGHLQLIQRSLMPI